MLFCFKTRAVHVALSAVLPAESTAEITAGEADLNCGLISDSIGMAVKILSKHVLYNLIL